MGQNNALGSIDKLKSTNTGCCVCMGPRYCWDLGEWQKDWSNSFNCLWNEGIMTFSQLSLVEIKRLCKYCFKQHRRKRVNKKKIVPAKVKCALAPKSDSMTSIPTGKRRPNQKYRKHFHGYTAHFLISYRLFFFFNLLPAVAVGCLQKQWSHTFLRIKMSGSLRARAASTGDVGAGAGPSEEGTLWAPLCQ